MILRVAIQGRLRQVTLESGREDGQFSCEIDGETLSGSARLLQPGVLSLLVGSESYRCILDPSEEEPAVYVNGQRYSFHLEDPRSLKARRSRAGSESGARPVKAPMPGRVVRILAEQGAQVEAHQSILVIEAMKMQNEIKASKAGRIAELRVGPGDTVNVGAILAVIE